ncbi:hypothetical protein GCM10022232_53430 [Streptomyces plumbiresistens]|uniref:Uncharacterized protein n=1 Tax=Streptomyces plumbiresistens TaxID=511811 RepID=A0ABP7S5Y1_9ACTN
MPERVATAEVGVRAPSETSRVSSRDWPSGDSQPERTGMGNSLSGAGQLGGSVGRVSRPGLSAGSVGRFGSPGQLAGSTRMKMLSNQQVTAASLERCMAVAV